MSLLDKMAIQGIRSFSPDGNPKEVEMIKFFKPITLILGPNGTGKTTIIECLRYMATGDTPPGTDKGCTFVHDPKVAHEIEIKGQVKLQLRAVNGKIYTATRSMIATQKQKKVHMKTLDGSIQTKGANGESISLTTKCAEFQIEMVSLLGVSKAILTNVIFCHQEDSNWPLSEGKTLKQKFDDIFSATRYIKALENIKKVRHEKMSDAKSYEQEVKYLKEFKSKAAQYREELKTANNRLAACKDKVKEMDEKVKPLQVKLEEIAKKEDDLNKLKSELASKEGKLEQQKKIQKDIKDNIGEMFRGELFELKQELNTLFERKEEKKIAGQKMDQKIARLQTSVRKLSQKNSVLLEELGKLKIEYQQHEERIAKRDKLIISLADELGMKKTVEKPLSEEVVKETVRNINLKQDEVRQEFKKVKGTWEEKEVLLQNSIDDLRDHKTKFEQSAKLNFDHIGKNKEELQCIIQKLSTADSMVNKQDDIEADLKYMENQLEKLEKSKDTEEFQSTITRNEKEITELEAKLSYLRTEMTNLQKENSIRTEIELIQNDRNSKENAIKKIEFKHKGTIAHLLGEIPKENIHNRIQDCMNILDEELKSVCKKNDDKKSQVTALKTTKKHYLEQLKKKENELLDYENKIFEVCGSQNIEDEILALQASLKNLHDDKGSIIGSQFLFKSYVSELQNPNPCCPLCSREFRQNHEAQNLIQNLQGRLQSVPSRLSRMEESISQQQEQLNNMLELRPLKDNVKKLKEMEVPSLKVQVQNISDKIKNLQQIISEEEEIIETKQSDLKIAASVQTDSVLWDQNSREIERIEQKLSTLICQLSGEASRNIKEVAAEQETMNKKLDALRNETDASRKKINDYKDQVQKIKEQMNNLKTEQLEIKSSLQQRDSLEERRAHLYKENKNLEKTIKDSKSEVKSLEIKIKEEREKKEEIIKNKEKELESCRDKSNCLERYKSDLDLYIKHINRYIREGKDNALTCHQNHLDRTEKDINKLNDELEVLSSCKKEADDEIRSFELKKVDLENNKRFLEYNVSINEMEKVCEKLRKEVGNLSATSILSEKREIVSEVNKLMDERQRNKGREVELQQLVLEKQKELNSDMLRDADKKCSNMIIKLRTTQIACDDLSKYHSALDRAVMQYHSVKMNEINKIIRELWHKAYNGNDIEYIKICSDGHEEGARLEVKKRTYNYRVVMVKDDVEIDMRGCCSAGQKVLASLIIRLALAETFCLNCGILALDEPTTNLDRKNIEGLVDALEEIVRARSLQENFQLIVITHDEDFVNLLGHKSSVEYFYKVSKDDNGYSRIHKAAFEEMI